MSDQPTSATSEALKSQRPIHRLGRVVRDQTMAYRKGEVVKQSTLGGVLVTSIDAFPDAPERAQQIDCHFITVGFTEAAADRQGFLDALDAALKDHGEWGDIDAARLAEGPSYIEIGAWIGDQTLALRFMALAEFHGRGVVITPAKLPMPEDMWDQLAGAGYVLLGPSQSGSSEATP